MSPPWGAIGWMPPRFWPWIKNYYAYGLDFVGATNQVPVSAAITLNIQIQTDAFFTIIAATMVETTTDNLTILTFRPLTVQIFDTASSQNFFNTARHVDEVFGDAEDPGIFQMPYTIKPGGTIAVTLTNLEATARHARMTLHGFKSVPNSNQETGEMYQGY